MSHRRSWTLLTAKILVWMFALPAAAGQVTPISRAAAESLRIVVIEGENGINIIEQNTAVTPIVEVRDRNNQPVAGVVVRFSINRGAASFNGVRTLSVTTNAAGRATASGLSATSSGALKIQAATSLQGQTATATITQTSFRTVSEAVSATAPVGGVGSSAVPGAGSGAGGSGGLSTRTLVIVAGAAAGGVVAVKAANGDSSPAGVDLTGTWVGTETAFGITEQQTLVLRQSGDSVSGTGLEVTPFGSVSGTIIGTVAGSTATLTQTTPVGGVTSAPECGEIVTIRATSITSTRMSGTFDAILTVCTPGSSNSGSFSLTKQ